LEKDASGSSAEKSLRPKKGGALYGMNYPQLEHVIQHPEEYNIQLIHVRLRVLSSRSWEAEYEFMDDFIREHSYYDIRPAPRDWVDSVEYDLSFRSA